MSTKTQDIDSLILKLEEKKKKLLQKKFNQRIQPISNNLKEINNILKKQINNLTDEDINSVADILKDVVTDLNFKVEENKKRKEEEKKATEQQMEEQNYSQESHHQY